MSTFFWSLWIALNNIHFGYFITEISLLWNYTPWIYTSFFAGQHATIRHHYNIWANLTNQIFAAVVALLVGHYVKIGRRRMLLIANVIVIISSWVMMVDNFIILMIGRWLRGVCSGIVSVTVPLFINEICTQNHKNIQLALIELFITVGSFAVYFISIFLPEINIPPNESKTEEFWASVQDKFIPWRIVFILPVIPALAIILLLLFKFKNDTFVIFGIK